MSVYRFEPFSYQPSRSSLTLDGEQVEMRQKTAQLLECFLRRPDELLSKEELLAEVWDDVTVGEAVVFQTISELRKLLARERPGETFIQTVKGKGYRWVYAQPVQRLGPVEEIARAIDVPSAKNDGEPSARFGLRLWGGPRLWVVVGLAVLLLGWAAFVHFHGQVPEAVEGDLPRLLLLADPVAGDPGPADRGLLPMAERVLASSGRLEVVTMGDEEQWFQEVARRQKDHAEASAHFQGFLGVSYVAFARLSHTSEGKGRLEFSLYRGRERLAEEAVDDVTLLEGAERLAGRLAELLGLEAPARQVAGSFSNHPRALDAFVRGEAAHQRGDTEIAAELFAKAVELDGDFLWAQAALARAYETLGEVDRADALVRKVLLGARTSEDYYLQVESLNLLAARAVREGNWDALLDYQRQIQEAAWRWGNRRIEAAALRMEGNYHRSLQNMEAAEASYRASLRVADDVGDRLAAAHAHNNLGTVALARGDYAAARDSLEKALESYRQTGHRGFLAGPLANLGMVERQSGRQEEARDYLERALEASRENDRPAFTARILSTLGLVSSAEGDAAEAVEHMTEAFELLTQIQDEEGRSTVAFNLAQIYLGTGELKEVPTLLRVCEEHWGDRQPHVQVLWAQYHHQNGEPAEALERMERAEKLYGDDWNEELRDLLASYRASRT